MNVSNLNPGHEITLSRGVGGRLRVLHRPAAPVESHPLRAWFPFVLLPAYESVSQNPVCPAGPDGS